MFLFDDPERKYLLFAEGDGDEGAGGAGDGAGDGSGDGDEGDGAPPAADDWRAAIEDESLRKVADRFASPVDAVKAVADLRKRESNSVRLPGKDASEEDIASYRKALGVPETVDGYEFSVPEGHEPTEDDIAFQKSAAEVFHKHNIPAEAAKGLTEWWNEQVQAIQQAQVEADKQFAEETESALRKEWPGEEFARNKEFADRAATRIFGDDLDDVRSIETKDGRFVLDHPAFVKMLAQYGREMEEGRLGGAMSENDKNDAQAQIEDLEKKIDQANVEGDRTKANELYIKQQELYRKMYGGGPIVGAEGRAT